VKTVEGTLSAVRQSTPARASRIAADWIGFLFFCAFALTIPLTAGSSGLLLLPPMLYEVAVAGTFLSRNRARRSLQGVAPRLIAYIATFLLPLFIWIAIRWIPSFFTTTQSSLLRTAGASFWLFGTVLSFWPIWYMRRSFSIEPAARELATEGPYRIARHPIYATQLLEYLGIWMLHATVAFAAALVGWLIIVRVRMRYEEQVLRDEFPEYASYQQRVGAFGPRLRPVLALSGE
jgi:protein-S-isoprenylcysteine O-methyltransferase Ste14